jgi:hypothetical protein
MDFEDIAALITTVGIILLTILLVVAVCFTAPKLVSEEKIEVTATITKTHHSFPMGGPYVYRAADYDIYFEYNGIKGSWDTDSETYNRYKDKVGEPIKCYLITRIYDDGSEEVRLVAVDDYERR